MTVAPLPRREAGFTLVEVMVALLIFAMLASAAVAILALSVRTQASVGGRLDDVSALNRTLSILSADLGQAVARPARDEGGVLRPALVGEAAGMTVVRGGWTNLDAAPRASLQKVTYRVAGDALERVAYPMLDGAQPLPPTVLLPRVRALHLRYRFQGAWLDQWQGVQGAALPQAAEVTIERTDGTFYRQMFLVGTGYAPARQVAGA
ncbi:type II secretion system minor pseudopilin GspJ [Sphingomonas sp. GM_Shp_2]|uniref:type II secretion system minor pseudopilin GspJ n=1 Tax=Sphingomonas sp. GM_Shp_2 TaxID=2937380 RepID=UPI00226A4912|nr:type II secretion system minor pseudopilin GspJ [Sphingomonas sp. GM_Shp_2]